MTHRQFLAWTEWDAAQWNAPDRHDQYLMQIAQVLVAANSKDPGKVKLSDMRLQFRTHAPARQEPALTAEEASARSQAAWFAAFGGKIRIMKDGKLIDPPGEKKPLAPAGKQVKLMREKGKG